jgi:hypothetical protein
MRGEMTILEQVSAYFLRVEADGTAELQVGQARLAEIENGFDADPKEIGNLIRCPKRIACRGFRRVHGRSCKGIVHVSISAKTKNLR